MPNNLVYLAMFNLVNNRTSPFVTLIHNLFTFSSVYANSLLAMYVSLYLYPHRVTNHDIYRLNARESLGRIVKGHANSIDTKATRATSSFALSAMRSGAGRGTNDSSSSEGRQPIQLSSQVRAQASCIVRPISELITSQIEFAPVKRDGKYPTTTLTEYDPSP